MLSGLGIGTFYLLWQTYWSHAHFGGLTTFRKRTDPEKIKNANLIRLWFLSYLCGLWYMVKDTWLLIIGCFSCISVATIQRMLPNRFLKIH